MLAICARIAGARNTTRCKRLSAQDRERGDPFAYDSATRSAIKRPAFLLRRDREIEAINVSHLLQDARN